VGELGEILELLHGARNRYRTVRAVIHHRYDTDVGRRARTRLFGHDEDEDEDSDEESQRTFQETSRVWFEPPDRIREEREDADAGWHSAIQDGGRWWAYDKEGVEHSNEDEPEVGTSIAEEAVLLFDPAVLIGALKLEPTGEVTVAGRRAHRVVGRPRGGHASWNLLHLGGGDEFDLAVDSERGVLLRAAARFEEQESQVTEVSEIAFDEDFGAETFRPVPGALKEQRVEAQRVSAEEAADLASFPLWLPALTDGWRLEVAYFPGDDQEPETVSAVFTRHDGTHYFMVVLSPAGAEDDFLDHRRDWESAERAGQTVQALPARERYGMQAVVRFEREGTRITLMSENLRHDSLLEIVETLEHKSGGVR
jgi:outer membrane lipoprotein-sorting protein